ncbi:MAG: DMT family transporter [Chlamydiales bacterium]
MLKPKTQLASALTCAWIASLFSAASGAIVKYSSNLFSTEIVLLARMLVSLLLLCVWIEWSRKSSWKEQLKTSEWKTHLIRGAAGLTTLFLYFYSLRFLSLADTTLLYNTMPIFVPLVAYVWRRIPIPHQIFWGIGTGFLGIALVLGPGDTIFHIAAFYAVAAGITGSIATVALRFAHYTEPMQRTLFYYFFIGTSVALLFALTDFKANFTTLDLQKIAILSTLGVFGFIYQILFTLAVRHAPARLISPSFYFSVVFAMLFDWWLWDSIPSLVALVGFTLVILGAFLTVYLYPKEGK